MALRQLDQPFPTFTDLDGSPLDAGYVYFGVENDNPETAPITVYYDAALTQAAAQPLRTSNGYVVRNGAPAVLYADVAYSLTVRNKTQALVFYSQSGDGLSPGGALVAANNLSDVASASASLVNLGLTATAAELNQINDKAPLASPALTGTPTAPTAAGGTNTTQLATAAFVQQETPELTQLEVENPASTVFGQVSGERLSQAVDVRVPDVLNATGTAPLYACRAWVNFNGIGTVAIRASGNVSSITDNGTGQYTVNFTTAMPDANYAVSTICVNIAGATSDRTISAILERTGPPLAGSVTLVTRDVSNALRDPEFVTVAIFR